MKRRLLFLLLSLVLGYVALIEWASISSKATFSGGTPQLYLLAYTILLPVTISWLIWSNICKLFPGELSLICVDSIDKIAQFIIGPAITFLTFLFGDYLFRYKNANIFLLVFSKIIFSLIICYCVLALISIILLATNSNLIWQLNAYYL